MTRAYTHNRPKEAHLALRQESGPMPDHAEGEAGENGIMESMKGWLRTKCRGASNLLTVDTALAQNDTPISPKHSRLAITPVTPTNIPEFTIPGSGEPSPRCSCGGDSDDVNQSVESLPLSDNTSPKLSPRESSPHLLPPPVSPSFRCKSAPVSPVKSQNSHLVDRNGAMPSDTPTDEFGVYTNVDPMSLAAMSLPHLKTVTTFGFETLSERPNTKRKESLFHMDSDTSPGNSPSQGRALFCKARINMGDESRSPPPLRGDSDVKLARKPSFKRRNVPSLVAPLGVILPPQRVNLGDSVIGIPAYKHHLLSLTHSNPEMDFRGINYTKRNELLKHKSLSPGGDRLYCRRRSSSEVGICGRCYSADSASSNEPSPNIRRRSCVPDIVMHHSHDQAEGEVFGNTLLLPKTGPSSPKAVSASHSVSSGMSSSCSCHSLNREECQMLAQLGEVKFAVQYKPKSQQLCVKLLKAENLGRATTTGTISPFAKLCLMPGKLQKQSSAVCKHNSDPVFNQTFYFKDMTLEQIQDMKLRIKFYHKSQNLRRDEFLGETQVALQSFQLYQESRMWKELEPKSDSEELGHLEITLCFQPSMEKLYVNVIQAKELPRHYLTGPPDPYIKVELNQPNRAESKRQTKVKKKSQNPTYHDEYTFNMSPKIEDINFTSLVLTIFDHETIRSDEAIGEVRLGFGATEDSEFNHWNQVLQNPGREYTHWHTVMEVQAEQVW